MKQLRSTLVRSKREAPRGCVSLTKMTLRKAWSGCVDSTLQNGRAVQRCELCDEMISMLKKVCGKGNVAIY